MVKKYSFKIIKSGNETEIYCYEEEQLKKLSSSQNEFDVDDYVETEIEKKVENKTDKQVIADNGYKRRESDIAKAKQKIRRLINANLKQWRYTDKFITLTFAENEDGSEVTREQVVYSFKKFKMRFKYRYGDTFQYIAVIERGTESTERLHIHMIVFDLPYIAQKELMEMWSYGFVYLNKIKTVKEVTKYITKYIDKTLEDDYIEKGKRFYFTSKGLLKPQELYLTDSEAERYMEEMVLGDLVTTCQFESEYIEGVCTYARYLLNENIELRG